MNRCLRCGKECGTATFCPACQSSLLNRFQQKEGPYETVPLLPQTFPPRMGTQGSSDAPARDTWFVPSQDNLLEDACENALLARVLALRKQRRFQTLAEPSASSIYEQTRSEHKQSDTYQQSQERRARLLVRVSRMRVAFVILTVFALVALIIDGILVSFVFSHHHPGGGNNGSFPLLTLTPTVVYSGQVVQLRLSNFAAPSRVLLTRDVAETVRTDSASPLVQIGATGEANVHILVEDSWGAGFHMLEAEDINTHYTASVALNVVGAGPPQAPHLEVGQTEIAMGRDLPGSTTLQPLMLRNTGAGIVTWAAKSSQPWLMLSPAQGSFSQSQRISIVVNRALLKPGKYAGAITFVTESGTSLSLPVKMSVSPSSDGAMLVVTPPVLAFSTNDSNPDPPVQSVTISNPGTHPLYWSLGGSTPTASIDQEMPFQADMSWLNVMPSSGILAPGATTAVQIMAHSHALLPGIYTGMVLFTAGEEALNNPQAVAVSLDVQPHCSIVTSPQSISFATVSGQNRPAEQNLDLHMQNGCTGNIGWEAFSSSNWLTLSSTHGQVQGKADAVTTVSLSSNALQPGNYTSSLVFLTAQHTQVVPVQITVVPSSSMAATATSSGASTAVVPNSTATPQTSSAPSLALAPADLMFSVTQGQPDPPGQTVTLANTGGSTLYWQVHLDISASSWLDTSATSGSISAGQTGQIILNTGASGLAPGTYKTQALVTASDASGVQVQGSPQIIQVTFTVFQPCMLEVKPGSLAFSTSLLQSNSAGQDVTLHEVGDCSRPVTWGATLDANGTKWLVLSSASGVDSSTITVHAATQGMLPGTYKGQITFTATDGNGAAILDNTQVVPVTVTVGV